MTTTARRTIVRSLLGPLVLTLLSTSCGSGAPGPDASASADPVGLHGTIRLRGALVASGPYDVSFTSASQADCESFAERTSTADEAASFILPLPTRVGDHHLSWTAAVRPYRGPGTYAVAAIPRFKLAVLDNDGRPARTYAASAATRATVRVASDGSGSFTFTALGTAPALVAGTARWTCADEPT